MASHWEYGRFLDGLSNEELRNEFREVAGTKDILTQCYNTKRDGGWLTLSDCVIQDHKMEKVNSQIRQILSAMENRGTTLLS